MSRMSCALFVLCAFAFQACGDGEPSGPRGTPIQQLFDAGTCPIEVTGITRSIGPMPTFRATIRNLADTPISAVTWLAVFRDGAGAAVGEPVEGGYADILSPVPPGGTIEGMFPAPGDEAVKALIVVKDLVYTKPNPINPSLSGLPAKWTNPNYARELESATK